MPIDEAAMNTEYVVKNLRGISIIHLRTAIDDGIDTVDHPQMDYHLHNLLYFDKEHKHVGALCLDRGDLYTYPCESDTYAREHFVTIIGKIAEIFVDRVQSMLAAEKYSRELLFSRESQELWDIFNIIKEYSFVSNLPRLAEYLPSCTVQLTRKQIPRPTEKYYWAEYEITEERYIEKDKVQEVLSCL